MSFLTPAAEALCPVSVLVHRCSVSSTCMCGRSRRSSARCTLTLALARAAKAAKSGTPGEMRSGRATNKPRSESSLRASSSLLSARIRDISPTLPPPAVSCPASCCHAIDQQHEHQDESERKPVECGRGNPGRGRLPAEGQRHDCSHSHQGKHCEDRGRDHQGAPETRGNHARNANSPATRPRLKAGIPSQSG